MNTHALTRILLDMIQINVLYPIQTYLVTGLRHVVLMMQSSLFYKSQGPHTTVVAQTQSGQGVRTSQAHQEVHRLCRQLVQ